jgi:hypothetical protein
MLEQYEFIILIFSVHAVKGLHILGFEDWAIRVIEIFFSKYLHDDNNLFFISHIITFIIQFTIYNKKISIICIFSLISFARNT